MKFLNNKLFKFAVVSIIYILWVIWIGSYWLLIGLGIIFDLYVSQKINWTFWKKKKGKNSKLVEWIDALIFAVIAVTLINIFIFQNYKIPTGSMENSLLVGDHLFVSKIAFGPKIPNTPLSFPFSQNTLPLTKTKSYLEWIQWPYKRLAGLSKVKRNNVVVFNCPALDTVTKINPTFSYKYDLWRHAERYRFQDILKKEELKSYTYYLSLAEREIKSNTEIIGRPVDRRDNYIKRCVGIPGDTIQLINSKLYINNIPEKNRESVLHKYIIITKGTPLNKRLLKRNGVESGNIQQLSLTHYAINLTQKQREDITALNSIDTIIPDIQIEHEYYNQTFPNHPDFDWTIDNFGPLYIPEKGKTIKLSKSNLPLYSRIIDIYEENDLQVKGDSIFINGEYTDSYTFKMDYYFMMGDNRHSSWDSRSWGYVPEDHIVGKPVFIWLSIDKDNSFLNKIRWERFFKRIK